MASIHIRVLKKYIDSKNIFCFDEDENILNEFLEINQVNKFDGGTNFDAVLICTPTDTHLNVYRKYQNLSKFFFIEKPLVNSQKELDGFNDEELNYIYCGLIETHNEIFKEIKNFIKDQKILSIQITRHSPKISTERISSDVDLDLAIHDLSVLLKYFLEVDEIESLTKLNNFKPTGFFETSEILLSDKNVIASISTSRITNKKIRFWRIITDVNTYEIDLIKNKVKELNPSGEYRFINSIFNQNISQKEKTLTIPEPADIQIKYFLDLVINETIDYENKKIMKKCHELLLN